VSQRPCLASTKTPVAKIKSPKTKPAENIDGFVSGLSPADAGLFCCARSMGAFLWVEVPP
jgi:hypothetical protein